jgi:hypothetical protein
MKERLVVAQLRRAERYLWRNPLPWLSGAPGQVISNEENGEPYLTRTFLTGRSSEGWPIGCFLHHFHRGDKDRELHNHPWDYSAGLILAGGYREERRMPDNSVKEFILRPGMVNVVRANTFHRVDMLDENVGCWTLFFRQKRIQNWGFWNRETGKYTPWREFVLRPNNVS